MQNIKIPVIFFLVAGLATYGFSYFYAKQLKRYDFPTVSATIDSVFYATVQPSGRSYYETSALYAYSFEIAGQTYNSNTVAKDRYGHVLTTTSSTFDSSTIEYIESQKTIEVYYNPEDPADSFLTPSASVGLLIGAIIMGLFSLLGLAGVFTTIFYKKPNHMLNQAQARQVVDAVKDKLKD